MAAPSVYVSCDHDWTAIAPNGMRWCRLCQLGQMTEDEHPAPARCSGCGEIHGRRDFGRGTCTCCSHADHDHAQDGCTFESCGCCRRTI